LDFSLTDRQVALQRKAQEFAKREITREKAARYEVEEEFPWDIYRKAAENGLIGVRFNLEYGGQGYGVIEHCLIVEELCRRDSTIGSALMLAEVQAIPLMKHGSMSQRKKYLPRIASGRSVAAIAITEPNHGSDILKLSTTATKVGDGWIINGVKTLITNGDIADFVMVLCQTDPNVEPSYRGQTMFIVERGVEGFNAVSIKGKMGIRATSIAELSFENVHVPSDALVGDVNKGFYVVMDFFDESRVVIAAQAVGIAQGALDRAVAYAKSRYQFGQRVADFQAVQHQLADVAIQVEAARLLTYKAAWAIDAGKPNPALASMAKAYAAKVAVEAASTALKVFGGYGCIAKYEVERYYRDARVTDIYEGTREIQKNMIAKTLLYGRRKELPTY